MAKQPYIPLYTGDYLKDTRTLPLAVRGAWIELLVFMWDSKERGVLVHTMQEYAMMMSCSFEDANFAIGLLQQKGVCDYEIMPSGMIKLISRRMVRETKLSKIRSEAGKEGAAKKLDKAKAKANGQAKTPANADNDNAIKTEVENKLKESLDELYIDQQRPKWSHIEFDQELTAFLEKVRGSPGEYVDRSTDKIRLAFQYQLRHAKKKQPNGTSTKGTSGKIEPYDGKKYDTGGF